MTFPKVEDRPYHLFTDEYEELRRYVRDLLEKRVVARADELDHGQTFPRDVFEALGSLGYLGLAFPAGGSGEEPPIHEDGGSHDDSGGPPERTGSDDPVAAAVVAEELGRTGLYGFAAAVFDHLSAGLAIALAGSPEQQQRWLTGLLAAKELWSLAVTEPHLDPDPGATQATVRESKVSGTKSFAPNAAEADHFVVGARAAERFGLYVVDAGAVEREGQELVGWKVSPIGELHLREAPAERLPGEARQTLARVRRWQALCEALALAGLARRAIDVGIAYGLDRHAFDRPVARFQVWRHRWADLSTEVEMARALAIQALRLFVHGETAERATAAARLYAGRVAFRASDECLQMHGGYGYMMEYPAQRFWRDARQATIVAGGEHPFLETIAREIGL